MNINSERTTEHHVVSHQAKLHRKSCYLSNKTIIYKPRNNSKNSYEIPPLLAQNSKTKTKAKMTNFNIFEAFPFDCFQNHQKPSQIR